MQEEAAGLAQAGGDGGWAREGAAEWEKWAGYEPVLKVGPTGKCVAGEESGQLSPGAPAAFY